MQASALSTQQHDDNPDATCCQQMLAAIASPMCISVSTLIMLSSAVPKSCLCSERSQTLTNRYTCNKCSVYAMYAGEQFRAGRPTGNVSQLQPQPECDTSDAACCPHGQDQQGGHLHQRHPQQSCDFKEQSACTLSQHGGLPARP